MKGTCKLCLTPNVALRESHIFPKFLQRHASDAKNRTVELNRRDGRSQPRQTPPWDYLLCAPCEARFNDLETYYARIWYGLNPIIPTRLLNPSLTLTGLDYHRFKHFHLSILWRGAVSQHPGFTPVTLGPHSERLRKILLAGTPLKASQYPVTGSLVVADDEQAIHHEALVPFHQSRTGGHHFYLGIYAGAEWVIRVSSHSSKLLGEAITAGGTLVMAKQRLSDISYVKQFMVEFLRAEGAEPA